MKIHNLIIAGSFLSVVLLSGCGNNNNKSSSEEDSVPGYTYTVSSEVYSKDNISIEYPKISGLNNDAEETWNNTFRDTMMRDAEGLTAEDKYEIKYDILTRQDNFLSILATGYRFSEGAAYPYNVLYTYNIEIPKGKSRRLESNEKINEYAERIFKGENYTLADDLFADAFRNYITQNYKNAEQVKETISGYDFSYGDSGSSIPGGFSYYKDGKTVICMEVPHAVGDYVKIIMD